MPSGPPTHQVAPLAPLAPVPVSPTQLTSNNFNSFVHSGADSLVEFYADWCGACQQVGRCVRWISRYLHCCASSGPSSRPWRRVWPGTMSSAAWSTSTRSGSWPGSTGSPGASTFLAYRDTVSILRHSLHCGAGCRTWCWSPTPPCTATPTLTTSTPSQSSPGSRSAPAHTIS